MNESNFEIQDVGKIDLSMDVGVKEIHPQLQEKELTINENGTHNIKPDEGYDALSQVTVIVNAIEDLTNELEAYDNELTKQETTIEEFIEVLQNKEIIPKKYAPNYISFMNFSGEDLSYEVSNLDTSKLTSLKDKFNNCTYLKTLDLSNWNVNNVTEMNNLFYNCNSLESVNLSNWNTSNVTSLYQVFNTCRQLASLNINHFDTSKVTTMYWCFNACQKLTSLDLSNWNTPNLKITTRMFAYCSLLKHLDIRNFDFSNVTSYTNMFQNTPNDCLIIVKDDTQKEWLTSKFTTLTNVKTVAELEVS